MKSLLGLISVLILALLFCVLQAAEKDDTGWSAPGQSICIHFHSEAILEESESAGQRLGGSLKLLTELAVPAEFIVVPARQKPLREFAESFFHQFIYRSSSGRSPPCPAA